MVPYNIKGNFVCEYCRNICNGTCNQELEEIKQGIINEKNKDLIGRKQQIKCLGRYCPSPCKYQDENAFKDVDLEPFINLINYLGQKCNELIEENNKLRKSQLPTN